MGGNNLPGIITTRKSPDDFEYIRRVVLDILHDHNIKAETLVQVPNKQDFGDLDVIVCNNNINNINFIEFIKTHFKPTVYTPVYKDTQLSVVSFNATIEPLKNHDTFQIDFIFCPEHLFNMHMFYYSYGDLCGILGRMVSAHGLKLGQYGLYMMFNAETMKIDSSEMQDYCLFSINPQEICKYLHLDYTRWEHGFSSKQDIFDWICTSQFYKVEVFTTLNFAHRTRSKKRPMYIDFLKYIDINVDDISKATVAESEIVYNYQYDALDYFKKQDVVEKIKQDKQKQRDFKVKYNAHIFIERGITDKNIPKYKLKYEEYITENYGDFTKYIEEHDIQNITNELDKLCIKMKHII